MEIVAEGLNQLIKLVALVEKVQWARAFQGLGESGELSKTIVGAIAAFRGVPAGDAVSHPTAEPRPESEPPGTSPSPPPAPSVDHAPSPVPIQISGRTESIRRRVSPEQLEEMIASIQMFSRQNGTGAEQENPVPCSGNGQAAITDQNSFPDNGESYQCRLAGSSHGITISACLWSSPKKKKAMASSRVAGVFEESS